MRKVLACQILVLYTPQPACCLRNQFPTYFGLHSDLAELA